MYRDPKNMFNRSEAEVGWVTNARDWAGELISAKSNIGRFLVQIF